MWIVEQIAFSGEVNPWLAGALGGLAVALPILLLIRRRRRDESPAGASFHSSDHREVERDISRLMKELSEMSARISGQLDARSEKLEALIAEADARLEELASAPASAPGRAEGLVEPPEAARQNGENAAADGDGRHGEIYRLADEGRTLQEIAQSLGRPAGEIELILALRTRGG